MNSLRKLVVLTVAPAAVIVASTVGMAASEAAVVNHTSATTVVTHTSVVTTPAKVTPDSNYKVAPASNYKVAPKPAPNSNF